MKLTTDDLAFFKRNGYVIKRGVLDPDLMARARERLWDGAPPSLRREEPASWVGPITADDESEEKANYRKGFRWQYREPGSEPWMVRLLAAEPRVWGMAEQLLGAGQLVPPERIRGIYCTLPFGEHPLPRPVCHVDAHPFHLGVVGYIDDVEPGGGGFAVWPGSHRKFYYAFASQYRYEPTDDYERIREECHRSAPVDCHGAAGDIVFWHHRIAHPPGRALRLPQAGPGPHSRGAALPGDVARLVGRTAGTGGRMRLSREELAFFKREGYLIKRGVMDLYVDDP